jgi:hypothetical protein
MAAFGMFANSIEPLQLGRVAAVMFEMNQWPLTPSASPKAVRPLSTTKFHLKGGSPPTTSAARDIWPFAEVGKVCSGLIVPHDGLC